MWGKSVHEAQIYKNASLKRDFSVTKSSKKGQLTGPNFTRHCLYIALMRLIHTKVKAQ
ncbi:hypothetical protein HMPREF1595_04510 [Escherichia coli 907672]|nr:hypothetical protein HMPREF1595_04510 [Escherichia coli 907672]